VKEANDWSECPWDEWHGDDPVYASREKVRKDIRDQSRSDAWRMAGKAMAEAKAQIREERLIEATMPSQMPRINQVILVPRSGVGSSSICPTTPSDTMSTTSSVSSMTVKERRQLIMRRSKSMAEAMVSAILMNSTFHNAVEEAGIRSLEAAEADERLERLEQDLECAMCPDEARKLEEQIDYAMRDIADQATYRTAMEKGVQQASFLKALDFADEVGPDIRMYNVCTQPDHEHGKCGFAFPSKLWWQKGEGTRFGDLQGDMGLRSSKSWSFKCLCEWGYLQEEALRKPGSAAAKWFEELSREYGDDFNTWPRIGCQQGFRPFKNGPSMVMEMKIDGEYKAFMSERLPEALDDAIKKQNYHAFNNACKALTPQEIYDSLPMCFPMTHVIEVNGKPFRGVARYPLAEWERKGMPVMTKVCWAKFCMKVAEKDFTNLEHVFRAAEKIV